MLTVSVVSLQAVNKLSFPNCFENLEITIFLDLAEIYFYQQ